MTIAVANAESDVARETLSATGALYLELMKRYLTNTLHPERETKPVQVSGVRRFLLKLAMKAEWRIVESYRYDAQRRFEGRDWPPTAETMVGLKRLNNLQDCIEDIILFDIPGDLVETGVWRGGATIFMRACLHAYGDTHRRVWVADSFAGLPAPNAEQYPADTADVHHTFNELRVSFEDVKTNFERYQMLDDRVRFLKGWFRDTLYSAPIEKIAVLRLDGDMYESTIDALRALYPRVSKGGYIIVDDYYAVPGCRQAVTDFRRESAIDSPIHQIDWAGAFWKRVD